jgi:hypothetical protein
MSAHCLEAGLAAVLLLSAHCLEAGLAIVVVLSAHCLEAGLAVVVSLTAWKQVLQSFVSRALGDSHTSYLRVDQIQNVRGCAKVADAW